MPDHPPPEKSSLLKKALWPNEKLGRIWRLGLVTTILMVAVAITLDALGSDSTDNGSQATTTKEPEASSLEGTAGGDSLQTGEINDAYGSPGLKHSPTIPPPMPTHTSDLVKSSPTTTQTPIAPIPTSHPTRSPIQGTCSAEYDNVGSTYLYYPDTMSRIDAISLRCGTLAPVTEYCPLSRQEESSYTYDPDLQSSLEALEANCGGWLLYPPWIDDVTEEESSHASLPAYRHTGYDRVPGQAYPHLIIRCKANVLAIYIIFEGQFVTGDYNGSVPVIYNFGSGPIRQTWAEVAPTNEGVWLPRDLRAGFVNNLRNNSTGELIFREPTTATAYFKLAGMERTVEPVLQACGW